MSDGAEFAIEDAKDGRRLVLSGNYLVSTIGVADDELRAIEEPISEIDLSGVREIDTVGAWVALGLSRTTGGKIVGASNRAARLIGALDGIEASEGNLHPDRPGAVARVLESTGQQVGIAQRGTTKAVAFIGQFIVATGSVIRHPRRFRTTAFVRQLGAMLGWLDKAQAQWTFSQAGFRLSGDARYVPTLITTTSETLLQQMEGLTLAYTQLLGSPPATPAAPPAN